MQGFAIRMGLVLILSVALGGGLVGAAEDSSELGSPPGGAPLEPVADDPVPPLPAAPRPSAPAPVDEESEAPGAPVEEEAPAEPADGDEEPPAEDVEAPVEGEAPAVNGFPAPEPCDPCPPPDCCPGPREPLPCPCDGYDEDGTIRRAYAKRVQQSLGHLVMGKRRLSIEGAGTLIDSPEGTLGEPVPAGTPAYDWDENDYELEFGARVGLKIAVLNTAQIEVRGFWLGEWDDSSRRTGAFGFSPPPGSASAVSPATLTSEAELWGGDAMWWHQHGCGSCSRFALGVGARFIRFDEVASVDNWTPFAGASSASVKSDVENQFFGFQVGALYEHDVTSRAMIEISARGFFGWQRMDIDVSDVGVLSGGAHSAGKGETDETWGFDIGVTGRYELMRGVAVSASYGLLFVADVQRAADSMDFSQAATGVVQARSDTDSLIAHSFFLGIQLDF